MSIFAACWLGGVPMIRARSRLVLALLLTLFGASLLSTPTLAQTPTSSFTSATRYDLAGRVTGTISADPDGVGGLGRLAERRTYDANGWLVRVESGVLAGWQDEGVAPVNWAGFSVSRQVESVYDAAGRKLRDTVSAGGVVTGVTQYRYDGLDRLVCSAVRMNVAAFGALPADACVLGPTGSQGADRIERTVYDGAGRVAVVQKAVGTPLAQDYARYSYTANGLVASVTDANSNRTDYRYDGFDRKAQTVFPSKVSAGSVDPADHEDYGYDASGNRTRLRKRDGSVLTYQYDALGRLSVKIVPERAGLSAIHTRDVFYGYDNRGLQLFARFDSAAGDGVAATYDALGRVTASWSSLIQPGYNKTLTYAYDANGNRTIVTHPDGQSFAYRYDGLDRFDGLFEGFEAGLYGRSYDGFGRVSLNYRTPGHHSPYGYDGLGRLSSQSDYFINYTGNVTRSYSYNPASQIASRTLSNDAYVHMTDPDVSRSYSVNGLNQYTAAGPASFTYDANGNLTGDGANTYTYDVENRLIGVSGARVARLIYDPLGRLFETNGTNGITRFLYDSDALVGEYDGIGYLKRRYVHGPGSDEPLFWYEGAGFADRRSLQTDHQGSIVSVAGIGGQIQSINSYDAFGIPAPTNSGRFQYTGQAWLAEIGCYHYKARVYCPTLGRFLQTDPIGYDDGLNWYAYVGGDPVNGRDPSGMRNCAPDDTGCVETPESAENPSEPEDNPEDTDKKDEIVVTGQRQRQNTSGDKEKFFVVTTTDLERRRLRQRDISCPGGGSVTVGTPGPIPSGASAAHSHPSSHSGVPGPGDNNFGNTSDTGYVITPSRAYAIDRASNGTYRTRILSGGGLSDSERGELVGNMQNWESGNSSDSSKTPQQRFCR
jgi:RHS repeat-associated protein